MKTGVSAKICGQVPCSMPSSTGMVHGRVLLSVCSIKLVSRIAQNGNLGNHEIVSGFDCLQSIMVIVFMQNSVDCDTQDLPRLNQFDYLQLQGTILRRPATGGAYQDVARLVVGVWDKRSFAGSIGLEDGVVLDERVFCNDYINLAHSMGVFLFDDLLAIVSLRYQRIHILQIRDSGSLVDISADQSQAQQILTNNVVNGPHPEQPPQENPFLSGIKQRLLSFIVRGIRNEEKDENMVGL
ncbi:light-mediated development protein DET1 isoform X1 [Tanacetum coccineum]